MISNEKKVEAVQKVKTDLFICLDDAKNKNLTAEERGIALKLAKAYYAAAMTLNMEFEVGEARGLICVLSDHLPFETKLTPFISLPVNQLMKLAMAAAEQAAHQDDQVNIIAYGDSVLAMLNTGAVGAPNVKVFDEKVNS